MIGLDARAVGQSMSRAEGRENRLVLTGPIEALENDGAGEPRSQPTAKAPATEVGDQWEEELTSRSHHCKAGDTSG